MKRFDKVLFPEGKSRACTLSYDDGVLEDLPLLALLNRYGVKCTFNLNAGLFGERESFTIGGVTKVIERVTQAQAAQSYAGHEVAGHGLYHSSLADIGSPAAMYEIIEDKRRLETIAGGILRTFALPFGAYDQNVLGLLRQAGYHGVRTIRDTHAFAIPEDFLQWHPTCHHADPQLMTLAHTFCEGEQLFEQPQLFYVWGHAYEFDSPDTWQSIERFLAYMATQAERVWFATNGQITAYIHAYRQLEYAADARMIYNPTATSLWVSLSGKPCRIDAGQTLVL